MITPEQCRAARGWLDWSQEELAQKANVALSTVRDFEKRRREPIANNIAAIEAVLEKAGVLPSDSDGEPGGIRVEHRIKERDTYLPTLRLLSEAPDGFLSTTDLIAALTDHFKPVGEDAEILSSRGDTRFSQIVRNVVSHATSAPNPIKKGWVVRSSRGLKITPEGREYLASGLEQKTEP